jgi:hypothetical protein
MVDGRSVRGNYVGWQHPYLRKVLRNTTPSLEVAYFMILSISRFVICNPGLGMAARLGGLKRSWKHGTERG